MPGATYSPQMIEKSDSTSLALATIAILGQAPSLFQQFCCFQPITMMIDRVQAPATIRPYPQLIAQTADVRIDRACTEFATHTPDVFQDVTA